MAYKETTQENGNERVAKVAVLSSLADILKLQSNKTLGYTSSAAPPPTLSPTNCFRAAQSDFHRVWYQQGGGVITLSSGDGQADGGSSNDELERGRQMSMEIRTGANNDALIGGTGDDEPLVRTHVPATWTTNQSRICSLSLRAMCTGSRVVDDQAEVRWAA